MKTLSDPVISNNSGFKRLLLNHTEPSSLDPRPSVLQTDLYTEKFLGLQGFH